ncbi:MAG: stage III sporulation protein AB [Bacillota bacterium]|nr:stage III sporulation protein AB [Bacillota bacterium]MDW7683189.1 stage III sporulation protein AB [Bacillota bacterium]
MVWVKWLGALLIIGAATAWGNQQAERMKRRVRELEEFRLALRLLTAEIGYTATPLPRALALVQNRLHGRPVRTFFSEACARLREPDVTDAADAWREAAASVRVQSALTGEDWPVLLRAAAGLGGLGRENQLQQLAAAEAQLAAHAASAAAQCESGERMWRYLGVMGGIAVVILLL